MAASTLPNIVMILTDDQGPWALGCCGNEELHTPNIDRLASTGTRFENFFCTSPVCSPARASLMTGRIPSQHGIHDWLNGGNRNPAVPYLDGLTCYTDVLAANGYTCGISGKWHMGDSIHRQHGLSHWFTMLLGGAKYNNPELFSNGQATEFKGYLTDIITDNALKFIDANASKDKPFYLSVHHFAPHAPFVGQHPRDIVDSYDNCPFKTCPQEAAHPWAIEASRRLMGDRESLKGYFAAITAVDLNVGRIVDKLEQLSIRDNTLIIYCSDNGYSCGHHGFWHKGNGTFPLNMYENSVKVPMVFNHPNGVPAGKVSPAMASQYDFMPTLLDYLGLPATTDDTLPGASVLPALLGTTDQAKDDVVVYDEYGPVRMIRTPEWKYVHRYPYGPHELYDMLNDADERNNLIDEKSKRPVIREMRQRLTGWFARYVVPELDGSRFPIDGLGQMQKIRRNAPGEDAPATQCKQDFPDGYF